MSKTWAFSQNIQIQPIFCFLHLTLCIIFLNTYSIFSFQSDIYVPAFCIRVENLFYLPRFFVLIIRITNSLHMIYCDIKVLSILGLLNFFLDVCLTEYVRSKTIFISTIYICIHISTQNIIQFRNHFTLPLKVTLPCESSY